MSDNSLPKLIETLAKRIRALEVREMTIGGSGAISPEDTVTSETAFGQASNPGAAVTYSRGDHTHGTPAAPSIPSAAVTVSAETTFGLGSNAGAAATYSKGDHTHGTPANPVSTDLRTRTINVVIDGGGAAIATGIKVDIVVDVPATIQAWTLLAKEAGAIKIDLWKTTYANFAVGVHPVDADSICNGHEPEIVATNDKAQDLDLSDWSTVTINAGDVIRVNVDSAATITLATLSLKILVS